MGERNTVSGAGRELRTHHGMPVATSVVRYTRSQSRTSENLGSADRRDPLDSDRCLPAGHVRSAVRESSLRLPGGVGAIQCGESRMQWMREIPRKLSMRDFPRILAMWEFSRTVTVSHT